MTEICKIHPVLFARDEFKIRFLIFSVIIALFIFPIIHADVLYADDHARAAAGWVSFGKTGRVFAELLLYFLHVNINISDTGPFFQIVSIFILAAPLALFSVTLNYNRLSAFVTLPFIVCTPFFLQNLSYRYDCLNMSLSLALAILAVCAQIKHKYFYVVLCVLGTLGFYQASFNSFLILSCLVGLFCLIEKGETAAIVYMGKALGCAGVTLVLYKIQIFLFSFIPGVAFKIRDYGLEHSAVNYHLGHLLKNLGLGLNFCFSDFAHGGVFLPLGCGMIVGITLLFAKILWKVREEKAIVKVRFFFCSLMLFTLSILSLVGPMVILENLPFYPRVMIGLGAFVSLCASFLVGRQAVWKGWEILPVFLSAFMLTEVILGAFAYGVVLTQEEKFDTKITDQIILDISHLTGDKPVFMRYLRLEAFPIAPDTSNTRRLQPWINDVFANNHIIFWSSLPKEIWQENQTPAFMMVKKDWENARFFSKEEAERIRTSCDYDHFVKGHFYSLYQKGDKIVIDFSSSCSKA